MKAPYLITIVLVVGVQFASLLVEGHKTGVNFSSTYLSAIATAAVLTPLIFALPAAFITGIRSLWNPRGRSIFFVRTHFYLMALLYPLSVLGQLGTLDWG
ncbi:hypothetical protein [Corallococcus sp. 4LFB]|uniref:hypothetical protein n=1 Tax=Corallococcus sp. 4LFB TaxID=3383249 RepID=UPI0039747BEF